MKHGRLAVTVGAAVASAILSAGVVSFAQGAPSPSVPMSVSSAPNSLMGSVTQLLDQLVQNGTISQSAANAIQLQATAGSIDPKSLVDSGALTTAQMRSVADGIDQIKMAAG
jgi:phage-related minor tail protein